MPSSMKLQKFSTLFKVSPSPLLGPATGRPPAVGVCLISSPFPAKNFYFSLITLPPVPPALKQGEQVKAGKILTFCPLWVLSEPCRCLTLTLFLVWCFHGYFPTHTYSMAKGDSPAVPLRDKQTPLTHFWSIASIHVSSPPTTSGKAGHPRQSHLFTLRSEL